MFKGTKCVHQFIPVVTTIPSMPRVSLLTTRDKIPGLAGHLKHHLQIAVEVGGKDCCISKKVLLRENELIATRGVTGEHVRKRTAKSFMRCCTLKELCSRLLYRKPVFVTVNYIIFPFNTTVILGEGGLLLVNGLINEIAIDVITIDMLLVQ